MEKRTTLKLTGTELRIVKEALTRYYNYYDERAKNSSSVDFQVIAGVALDVMDNLISIVNGALED